MKFDKRITDVSKIMNCFTTEDAKRYLHTYGYFADHIEDFAKLNEIDMNELTSIQQDFKYPYAWRYDNTFKFFLPCAFVADEEEKKEKKLRPYKTVSEFFEKEGLDTYSKIRIRNKNHPYDSQTVHIVGFGQTKINDDYIEYLMMGCHEYTLDSLFKNFEFQLACTDEFKPFGVEE